MRSEFQKIKDDLNIPGVKIGHLNVNGLLSKMAEVKILLQETNLDILAVTETKISADLVNQIEIEGYSLVRKDRNNNDGGVLIYYKDTLVAHEETKLVSMNERKETVWLNVVSQSQTWLVGCIYRPPDNNLFFDEFHEVLERIWLNRKNVLLV